MVGKKRSTIYIDETLWQTFKELCVREGVNMSEKIQKYIARYVAVHLPGNPQLPLETFIGPISKTCFFCEGKFPAIHKVEYISGLIAGTCSECLERERGKTTVKKVIEVV